MKKTVLISFLACVFTALGSCLLWFSSGSSILAEDPGETILRISPHKASAPAVVCDWKDAVFLCGGAEIYRSSREGKPGSFVLIAREASAMTESEKREGVVVPLRIHAASPPYVVCDGDDNVYLISADKVWRSHAKGKPGSFRLIAKVGGAKGK